MNEEELAYFQMEGRHNELDRPSSDYDENKSDTYEDLDGGLE